MTPISSFVASIAMGGVRSSADRCIHEYSSCECQFLPTSAAFGKVNRGIWGCGFSVGRSEAEEPEIDEQGIPIVEGKTDFGLAS